MVTSNLCLSLLLSSSCLSLHDCRSKRLVKSSRPGNSMIGRAWMLSGVEPRRSPDSDVGVWAPPSVVSEPMCVTPINCTHLPTPQHNGIHWTLQLMPTIMKFIARTCKMWLHCVLTHQGPTHHKCDMSGRVLHHLNGVVVVEPN